MSVPDSDKDQEKEKEKDGLKTAAILDEQKKRFWLLVTTMVETWIFSGLMYGWPSLVLMFNQEGFYANHCQDAQPFTSLVRFRRNDTLVLPPTGTTTFKKKVAILDDLLMPRPAFAPDTANYPHDCADRDRKLHAFFTMGIFLLCSTIAPANFVVSKFGVKPTRVVAVTLVGLSLIILAVITPDQADAIFVSVLANSLGGSLLLMTSFPVAKLFDHLRLSIACFLLGLHAASGSIFPMIKALYDAGIPRAYLMLALAALSPLVIFNALVRAKPSQEGQSALSPSGTPETKDIWVHCNAKTATAATWSEAQTESQSELDFFNPRTPSDESRANYLSVECATVVPFHRVLFTPLCIWTFVTSSVTKLHLFLFMGSVAFDQTSQQYDEGAAYAPIFGILQLGCVATTLMVAIVLERNNSVPADQRMTNTMTYLQNESRDQRVKNFKLHSWVFLIINTVLVMFDTLTAVRTGYLQIFTFLCHVLVRGALTASLWSLYSCSFFRAHFWTLIGLEALISGVITFLQHPIVVICQVWPVSTCYWVTVGLRLSSLLGYALPWHIRRYCRSLSEWDKASKAQKMSPR